MATSACGAADALREGLQSSGSLHSVSCLSFQEISFTILTFVCYDASTFCLSLPKLRRVGKAKGGGAQSVSQPLVSDQQPMGMPKEGGNKPNDLGLRDFKVLPEHKGVGPRVQKLQEPKPQPSDPGLAAHRRLLKEPRGSAVFENSLRVPRPLSRKPSEQRGEAEPFQPTPAKQEAAERLGKPPPEGAGGETGLSEELQQREEDYVTRVNARLANSSFTEEEKQGHKERLIDILGPQNAQVARLKDLSWVREHMQRAGFEDPVEWLISEGNLIMAPPSFGRFRRPLAWFRNKRDQLYRDKVKEVVRYWREQGLL
jgi:hypothetical protein